MVPYFFVELFAKKNLNSENDIYGSLYMMVSFVILLNLTDTQKTYILYTYSKKCSYIHLVDNSQEIF